MLWCTIPWCLLYSRSQSQTIDLCCLQLVRSDCGSLSLSGESSALVAPTSGLLLVQCCNAHGHDVQLVTTACAVTAADAFSQPPRRQRWSDQGVRVHWYDASLRSTEVSPCLHADRHGVRLPAYRKSDPLSGLSVRCAPAPLMNCCFAGGQRRSGVIICATTMEPGAPST